MSSDNSDDSLEYVTIDSVPWSQGHQRRRMNPEERKVKHRLVQRRHMERKRERIAQLQASIKVLELQLKLLKATHETKRLTQEQHALQQRFEARQQPWALPSEAVEELIIAEMLAEVDAMPVDAHLKLSTQTN